MRMTGSTRIRHVASRQYAIEESSLPENVVEKIHRELVERLQYLFDNQEFDIESVTSIKYEGKIVITMIGVEVR